MIFKKKWLTLSVVALSALGLAACSNRYNGTKPVHLSETYNTSKTPTKSGDNSTLKVAEVNDAPFAGITAPTLQSNAEDVDVYSPGGSGNLFNNNKNYKITKGGLANLKLNKSKNTATITLRKGAKWSNGKKVTAKDVEYPYEIIANKNSKSQQYSSDMNDIKGLAAYHKGTASSISGITMPDGAKGRKVVIHYQHLNPALKYNGNDFMWGAVEPYEYLKNVPISKLASCKQVRKHPIFVGPYKLKKQVQGESTDWVPNKYFYGKKPHIKNIDIQVVSTNNFAEALKTKKYDFTFGGPSTQYQRVRKLKDYTEVGAPELGYSYMGFNVGHATKSGKNVMDKNAKMANPKLRRAMMYAIDLTKVAKKFGNGVSYHANSLIPPVFKQYHASKSQVPGFNYNMGKAKKLLKEAGYKKRHGSKYVSKPNGKKLVVHFGAMTGSSASEAEDQYFLQQWRKLGIDAKFTNGKPMEMNSFYSTLQKPKQHSIDVFEGAFEVNSEPTPTGLYGPTSSMNMGHFASKYADKLYKEMNSTKAYKDPKYREKVFKKWQKYMNKEAAYAPEFFGIKWTPVNSRVTGFSYSPAANNFWSNLGLNSSSIK